MWILTKRFSAKDCPQVVCDADPSRGERLKGMYTFNTCVTIVLCLGSASIAQLLQYMPPKTQLQKHRQTPLTGAV